MKLFKLCAVTLFVSVACGIVSCQQQYQHQGALGSSFNPNQAATTPRPVYPPAQVHYVNIGEDLTGDYKFGYDTGKNGGGQSFREESRHPDGTVKGAYGYVDADGKQRIVKYTAGIEGFKVESDEAAPGSGSPAPAQTPAPRTYSPPPQPQQPQQVYRPPQPQPQPQPQQVYRPPQPQQVYRPQPQPEQVYRPPQPQALPQEIYRAPSPASFSLPASSQASQPLGGYTPVAPSSQQQYAPPAPIQAPQPAFRASPLPNYVSAAQQATRPQPYDDGQYRPQSYAGSSVPSYSATLGQRQPTLAPARPAHLASIPRNHQGYQGISAGFGSSQPQESSTWGPPVINKELLSYNIGTQG